MDHLLIAIKNAHAGYSKLQIGPHHAWASRFLVTVQRQQKTTLNLLRLVFRVATPLVATSSLFKPQLLSHTAELSVFSPSRNAHPYLCPLS